MYHLNKGNIMLHKTLGHLHWFIRPILVLLSLLGLQHYGLMDVFLEKNPIFRLDTPKLIFIGFIFIIFSGLIVSSVISKTWNTFTPIKDKATYIEDELCYAISISLGTAIMYIAWLRGTSVGAVDVIKWAALASLPSIAIGWLIRNWQETLHPQIDNVNPDNITVMNKTGFAARCFAYVAGALVFGAAVILSLQAVFYIGNGQNIDWRLLAPFCFGASFLSLVLCGTIVVNLGHKILGVIGIEFEHEKVNQSIAYALGCLTSMTVVVAITLGVVYFQKPDSLLSWSSYAVAYLIITLCLLLASASFGCLYPASRQTLIK